jgi:hypothetical protein
MIRRLDWSRRSVPALLGALTLGFVGLLLLWDVLPGIFPAGAHNTLGALPLGLIAVAYLVYQFIRRPTKMELLKAVALAAAFLFWAANQLLPDGPRAVLFNDIAIALFVVDVFLVIVGDMPTSSTATALDGRRRTVLADRTDCER